jgi:hypothetical protein
MSEILARIYDSNFKNVVAPAAKKTGCPIGRTTCTNCTSMHIVASASRDCYDFMYQLQKPVTNEKFKKNGETSLVLNYCNFGYSDIEDESEMLQMSGPDTIMLSVVEATCIELGIKFDAFFLTLQKNFKKLNVKMSYDKKLKIQ